MKKILLCLALTPLLLGCEQKNNNNQTTKYTIKEVYNNVGFTIDRETLRFHIEYKKEIGVDPSSGTIIYDTLIWNVYLDGYYVVRPYDYVNYNTFFVCEHEHYFLINYTLNLN